MSGYQPRDDEFVAGHRARLPTELLQEQLALADAALPRGEETKSLFSTLVRPVLLKALASLSNLEMHAYVRRHTLIPFVCFLNYEARGCRAGMPCDIPSPWVSDLVKRARSRAYACWKCAEEDQVLGAGSWWRRSHQIPGTYSCARHTGHPLGEVDLRHGLPPLQRDATGQSVDRSALLMGHPLVARFAAVCGAMLTYERAFSTGALREALIYRGRAAGLRVGTGGRKLLLSDIAVDEMPNSFLEEVFFRNLQMRKEPGKVFLPIDAVLNKGHACSVRNVALAFTLLYDGHDEAFEDCLLPQGTEN